MDVWLAITPDIDTLDTIWGVFSSVDEAVDGLKSIYAAPYIVEWDELAADDDGGAVLVGRFSAVPGYSTEHGNTFEIRRMTLDAT